MPVFLDTHIFAQLALGDEGTADVCRRLINDRYEIFCTDTVLQELGAMIEKGIPSADRTAKGLAQMKEKWWINTLTFGGTAANGIIERVARELFKDYEKRYTDLNYNDFLKIAEAATPVGKIHILLTWKPALLAIPKEKLWFDIGDQDLYPVIILTPQEVINHLKLDSPV